MTKLSLSKWAINRAILHFEVSWTEKHGFSVYNKNYARPVVPAPDTTSSGFTIGFGYDCGYYSAAKIRSDWSSVLPKQMVDIICGAAGLKKHAALAYCNKVKHLVYVPADAASLVFFNTTLYEFGKKALAIYPKLPNLHPVEQTVIIGLVYNRGASLVGDRRREMRQLITAIENDDDKGMANLIRQMKRLWVNVKGLRIRRDVEAELIEMADTPLEKNDLLILEV